MILGFLGSGKMASALARGVVRSGAFPAGQVIVTDVMLAAAEKLAKETGSRAIKGNAELTKLADVLILCVKPGDALQVLREISPQLGGKLVISIVAGLPLKTLQAAAGEGIRLVRVMPNTPALIGQGAAAFSLGSTATSDDAAVTEKILGGVGLVVQVKEELLDVVTGLSGSGPAFVYTVVEALADGAVLMGLPRDLALRLAAQTVAGAAGMVRETGEHPGVLRDQVASPGGTTIAGLEALERNGLRAALIAAVRAATERSRELGR